MLFKLFGKCYYNWLHMLLTLIDTWQYNCLTHMMLPTPVYMRVQLITICYPNCLFQHTMICKPIEHGYFNWLNSYANWVNLLWTHTDFKLYCNLIQTDTTTYLTWYINWLAHAITTATHKAINNWLQCATATDVNMVFTMFTTMLLTLLTS